MAQVDKQACPAGAAGKTDTVAPDACPAITKKPRPDAGPTGITGHTKLVTLIGKPSFHSVSPATHSLAYRKLGVDAVFLSFEVDLDGLPAVMEGFRNADGWDHITVTMPLKQAIIEYMDDLAPNARMAQAVNIVKKEADGTVKGYNSDGEGFMNNLAMEIAAHNVRCAAGAPTAKEAAAAGGQGVEKDSEGVWMVRQPEVPGSTVTMVGPGGAGRAILVQAALDGVSKINAFARGGGNSFNEAKKLAERIEAETDCKVEVYPLEDTDTLVNCINESDVLINGTNVGMGIGNTDTPIDPALIRPGMVVAEVINTPRETQLLIDAKKRGCLTCSGLGMNDQQAVVADRIRFGIEIPIRQIRDELDASGEKYQG